MPESHKRSFLVGTFVDPDAMMRAIRPLREEHFAIHDVYTPYPVHGLDEAMGLRRTRLPWVTLGAGLTGLTFAICFQFYTSVLDWPLNVGGKPDNSTLAFVPVSFELTVLFAGLVTVAALLLRSKLFPGKREELPSAGVTNDEFALVLPKPRDAMDLRRARDLLSRHGARDVQEKEAAL